MDPHGLDTPRSACRFVMSACAHTSYIDAIEDVHSSAHLHFRPGNDEGCGPARQTPKGPTPGLQNGAGGMKSGAFRREQPRAVSAGKMRLAGCRLNGSDFRLGETADCLRKSQR